MLDYIEEMKNVTDNYLGLLSCMEDVSVYGYITNSNVKFILFCDDLIVKHSSVKQIFNKIHTLYVKYFYFLLLA